MKSCMSCLAPVVALLLVSPLLADEGRPDRGERDRPRVSDREKKSESRPHGDRAARTKKIGDKLAQEAKHHKSGPGKQQTQRHRGSQSKGRRGASDTAGRDAESKFHRGRSSAGRRGHGSDSHQAPKIADRRGRDDKRRRGRQAAGPREARPDGEHGAHMADHRGGRDKQRNGRKSASSRGPRQDRDRSPRMADRRGSRSGRAHHPQLASRTPGRERSARPERKTSEIFQRLDTDGDDQLSEKEFAKFMQRMRSTNQRRDSRVGPSSGRSGAERPSRDGDKDRRHRRRPTASFDSSTHAA